MAVQCISEDIYLTRSLSSPSTITCLTKEDAIGLVISAEAGLLSLLAILFVLLIVARNVRWRRRHLRNAGLRIFHQPMDYLMASLLTGDALQAIGVILSLKWVRDGKVEIGIFCDAQGIIKIYGATAVALSTMAIAIYTFLGVWATKEIASTRFTMVVVLSIWSFVSLLVAVSVTVNRNQDVSFFGPTPKWCWVNQYEGIGWKVALEYIWMWATLALSVLLYFPLYLWMRGNLIIDEKAWWKFHFSSSANADAELRARRRRSLVMLAYPLVYCLCILPLSAVRWTAFVHRDAFIPSAATFAVVSIFALSGFFNVILLMKTRPSSGLFGRLMFTDRARLPSVHEHDNGEHDDGVAIADHDLGMLPPG